MTSLRLQVLRVNRDDRRVLDILTCPLSTEENLSQSLGEVNVKATGVWVYNQLPKGSIIHVLDAEFDENEQCYIINNARGLLVIEPDNLITCTAIATSLYCERKTWINNLLPGPPGTSKAMLIGTLVHEVFQYGVKNRVDSQQRLIKFLDQIMDDATIMLECYSVESSLKEIRSEVIMYIKSVSEWITNYMLIGPPCSVESDPNIRAKVIGINDIEENVWSTKYGLKGKIDVTGSVRIYDKHTKNVIDQILPIELKTGNPNISTSHSAQVSLYSIMIEDRYDKTDRALLVYLKNQATMHSIDLTRNVRRDLVQRRNQLNHYMRDFYFGPDMKNDLRMCQNCDRLTECIYLGETYNLGILGEYSNMSKLRNEAIGHLSDKFLQFFKRNHERIVTTMLKTEAYSGIDPQTGDSRASSKSFWMYSSSEMEEKGMGYGNLNAFTDYENSQVLIFRRRTFKQKCDGNINRPFKSHEHLSKSRVAVSLDSDKRELSDANSNTALLIGFIQKLTDDEITFKVYEGSLDIIQPLNDDKVFRLDRLVRRPQLDIERSILTNLLIRENWRVNNIRRLLTDETFKPEENPSFKLFILSKCLEDIEKLETNHQEFVVEAAATDNFSIMPWSDNSVPSQVDEMVKTLMVIVLSMEKTVLVVSWNIDELIQLMKLLELANMPFNLIDDGKSATARKEFANHLVLLPDENRDLESKYKDYIAKFDKKVILTSYTMAFGGLLFTQKSFDFGIFYNFSCKELLPSLGPMFCCDRWILLNTSDTNIKFPIN